VIFDVFDLPDAKSSPLWISGRTGIPVETVNEALEGLVVLGILVQTAKGYEKVKHNVQLPYHEQSKNERMSEHALISHQILNHLDDEALGALRFSSFASNMEIISEMYEAISEAIYEADRKSNALPREKTDNIYLISFTAVTSLPLKKTKGAGHV
jgi:hypothetical protein